VDGLATSLVVADRPYLRREHPLGLSGRTFYKMSGSGNDFVVFDARHEPASELGGEAIRRICARGTGVGADGVVFVEPSTSPRTAFRMRYVNSDGSPAMMCGNAALCVTRLAAEIGAGAAPGMVFESESGEVRARLTGKEQAEVDLDPVPDPALDAGISLGPGERRIGYVKVGVPHLVVLCDNVETIDVVGRGRTLRGDRTLPEGANVNFVSSHGSSSWRIRTYERGVEGETLACGTGAVASAILLAAWGQVRGAETSLEPRSGSSVSVRLEHRSNEWLPTLRGEGRLVYTGILVSP